jgi:Rieske Fe-S protein
MGAVVSTTESSAADQPLDRRGLFRATAATGVVAASAGVLAACGNSSGNTQAPSGNGDNSQGAGSPTVSAGIPLAATSDVPVGEGKVLKDKNVVVTQPNAGTYKAFSAVCTHQGCTVGQVANGVITCPCHGSQFSATDGSVKQGPAKTSLPTVNVTVQGNEITTA